MADRADVVPLRRRGGPDFPEPIDYFVDAVDPAHALSVTWSPDHQAVQLTIGTPDGEPMALILVADHVLELVRTLVEGLPDTGPARARPPATVLQMHPRPTE